MNEAEKMLADLELLVCDRLSPNDTKRQCIRIAYELGKSDGRVAGAEDMGRTMTESLDRSLDHFLKKVTA